MRRSLPRTLKAAGLLLLCGAALLPPARARACGNAVSFEEERVNIVLAADKWLREGRPKATAELLLQHYPSIKTLQTKEKLVLRARRIVALSIVRTDGLLPIPAFAASTNDDRRKNLEWAIQALRDSNADAPDTPVILAALGEALATLPEHLQEAYDILARLAARDVLPSAHGYRTLAYLRKLAGDPEGEQAALARADILVKSPPPAESFPKPRRNAYTRFRGRW